MKENSIVRQNMMDDVTYRPYCMTCKGLQRFGKEFNANNQLVCPICNSVTKFPVDFINRYKDKHNI